MICHQPPWGPPAATLVVIALCLALSALAGGCTGATSGRGTGGAGSPADDTPDSAPDGDEAGGATNDNGGDAPDDANDSGDDGDDDSFPDGDSRPGNENESDDTGTPGPVLPCIACHSAAMGDRRPVVDASGVGGHHLQGEALTNDDCLVCHEMSQHQQGNVRLWEDPTTPDTVVVLTGDPSRDPAEADKLVPFCGACHGESVHGGHPVSADWQPSCVACHNLHDPESANLSLVASSVFNFTLKQDNPVVFTARSGTGSFDDGDSADNDGICQVCHTATDFHRHDGAGIPHNDGADCTACHQHEDGFIPTAGDSCIACHSTPQGSRPAVVDATGVGGHHLTGDTLTDTDCERCHDQSQHRQGQVRLWANPNQPSSVIVLEGDPGSVPAEGDKLTAFCVACHGAAEFTIHGVGGAWEPVCIACHALHDPADTNLAAISPLVHNVTLSQDRPVTFTALSGPGSFSDGVGADDGICQVCHTVTAYHLHDGGGAAHNEGADCTECHAHNAGFVPAVETSCIACHSSAQGSRPAVVDADGTGGHHLGGGALTDTDCATCHDTSQHRQGGIRLWSDPDNPTAAFIFSGDVDQLVPFCHSCHDGTDHPTVHTTGQTWEPACTECHDLHGLDSSNLSLISALIYNQTLDQDKPVIFAARVGEGSFSDGVEANDGVCQVCHTVTTYHMFDGSGAEHNAGADCTACHEHAAGFIPTSESSCIGCHSGVQASRRAVLDEFGLASHHVQGVVVSDADCEVCHDTSQHQQGTVLLKNADNPGTLVQLTGDPMASPIEAAKLESFCLACHDSDAAGGSAPFSNGAMPAPIDATLWASASHSTGQTTCMGDGETFGCHSTGHGSIRTAMLAPWDGSQPGISGDPLRQEEGLCYSCHDADGPAPTNVQAQFALASRHNVSADDQTDGSEVECVHCHDPHVARAAVPLINPDTRAAWTGSGEAFCLTCHDGTPPSGVSFALLAPGSGYDKSSFVGTTHDSELGEDSCSKCHDPHGSSHRATLRNRYVVDDFNEYSIGDGDYAACWACHDENFIIEQENRFERRHKKHVKDKDSPCIACHNAHGGFDPGEPGLIDLSYPDQHGFDFDLVRGKDASTAFWLNDGQTQGSCFLRCHGEDHDPED